MKRWQHAVRNWRPIQAIAARAKRTTLPGFHGMSLYEVARFFFTELKSNKVDERSKAVTFHFLLAIPPTLLFLFTLVPYLPLEGVQATILRALRMVITNQNIYDSAASIITDFMNTEQQGILSFGLLLTLLFSSNGMMGLMRSFDRSQYSVYVKRTGLNRRWTSIKLTLMLMGVAVLSIVVLILQTRGVNELILRVFDNVIVTKLVSFIILILLIFSGISIIYRYGASLSSKFRFISPGSVFATVLCILTTAVFFYLVNNFINYNKIYGSIGSLIAFMIWLWLNTLAIILGYELNVSILLGEQSKTKAHAEKEPV